MLELLKDGESPFLIWRSGAFGCVRRLWEISENLHRAELTGLERGEMVAERVELTGFKPEQNVPLSGGGRGNKEGISQAARHLRRRQDR